MPIFIPSTSSITYGEKRLSSLYTLAQINGKSMLSFNSRSVTAVVEVVVARHHRIVSAVHLDYTLTFRNGCKGQPEARPRHPAKLRLSFLLYCLHPAASFANPIPSFAAFHNPGMGVIRMQYDYLHASAFSANAGKRGAIGISAK